MALAISIEGGESSSKISKNPGKEKKFGNLIRRKKTSTASLVEENDNSKRLSGESVVLTHDSVYPDTDPLYAYSASKARTTNHSSHVIDIEKGYSEIQRVPSSSDSSAYSDEDVYIVSNDQMARELFSENKALPAPAHRKQKSIFSRAVSLVYSGDGKEQPKKKKSITDLMPTAKPPHLENSADEDKKSVVGHERKKSITGHERNKSFTGSIIPEKPRKRIEYLRSESKRMKHKKNISGIPNLVVRRPSLAVEGSETEAEPLELEQIPEELQEKLRTMGIEGRQLGDMDFDNALLLVMVDPTNPAATDITSASDRKYIFDSALRANEDGMERMCNQVGDNNPEVIERKLATADMYKGLGMPHAAEILLRQVVQAHKLLLSDSEDSLYDLCSSMNDLALLLMSMQKYGDAEKTFLEIVDPMTRLFGDSHPDMAVLYGNLAIAIRCQSQRNFDNAIAYHGKAVEILEVTIGQDHTDTIYQRAQMGVTFIKAGQQKGKRMVRDALTQLKAANIHENHPWLTMLSDYL